MNNRVNDGIRYPSIDQLVTKTTSKYKLVIGAAKRAKEIIAGDEPLLPKEEIVSKKPIGMALEEILADKVVIK